MTPDDKWDLLFALNKLIRLISDITRISGTNAKQYNEFIGIYTPFLNDIMKDQKCIPSYVEKAPNTDPKKRIYLVM